MQAKRFFVYRLQVSTRFYLHKKLLISEKTQRVGLLGKTGRFDFQEGHFWAHPIPRIFTAYMENPNSSSNPRFNEAINPPVPTDTTQNTILLKLLRAWKSVMAMLCCTVAQEQHVKNPI
jgi:hypothetical protein